MRLGRLQHDPQRLAAAPSLAGHRFAATPPAPFVDRSAVAFEPGLFQNDTQPNCTAVGVANTIGMIGALNGFQPVIQPSAPLRFYAATIGQPNATDDELAATDGANVINVLQYQAAHGFDAGQQVPLVGLWGTLPDVTAILKSTDKLGHSYVGVRLYERDMEMRPTWDVEDGRDDGKLEGLHLLVGWDYTDLRRQPTVRLATWGRLQPATPEWIQNRLDEAHALVYRQLAATSGADLGVDVAMLQADLAAFSA